MTAALATRRAHLVLERDLIDAAGGGALWLLPGAMAASPEEPPASAPLAIIALPVPSFTLDAALAQMTLVAQGHAALSGYATWARFVDGAGNAVRDCSAGLPGSGAQVIVTDGKPTPSNLFWVGGEVNVTATIAY